MEKTLPIPQQINDGPRKSKNQIGTYEIEKDTLFEVSDEKSPDHFSFDAPDQQTIQGGTGDDEQLTINKDNNWQEIVGSGLKQNHFGFPHAKKEEESLSAFKFDLPSLDKFLRNSFDHFNTFSQLSPPEDKAK